MDRVLSRARLETICIAVIVVAVAFVAMRLGWNAFRLDTWLDEGSYLAKGWWYATERLQPYSPTEPTLYMPLYFYLVGWLQQVFGVGYLPGRLFSVLCALLVFWLAFDVTRRLTDSLVAPTAAVVLLASQYPPLIYYATATPYALCSLLSLLAVRLLIAETLERWLVWIGIGLLLYALFFTRPNMLVFAMAPGLWLLAYEPPRRWLPYGGLAVAGFLLPAAATVLVFGYGLFENAMRTPGLSHIAEVVGLFRSEFWRVVDLTSSPYDPQGQWQEIFRTTRLYLAEPYLMMIVVIALAVLVRLFELLFTRASRRLAPLDILTLYFVAAAVLHLLLSQSYCVPCIMPYVNYFLPFGAVVGGLLVGHLLRWVEDGRRTVLSAGLLGLLVPAAAASQAFMADTRLLSPAGERPSTETAAALGAELRPLLPSGEPVLVLSPHPLVAQAVWLAGNVVEPLSMNLFLSYREFREDISPAQRAIQEPLLRRSGFWNGTTLRRIIAEEVNVLVVSREEAYGEPFVRIMENGLPLGTTVAAYFAPFGSTSVDGYVLDVYLRRDAF